MSHSNIQVLLHQGELLHIVEAIRNSRGSVGGCLFGLWRNSLKQPVIQFVTGPSRQEFQERSVKGIFNSDYNEKCEKILFEDHAILKLGFWFSGSDDERNAAYDFFAKSTDSCLLLFISFTGEKLAGDFFLKKENTQDHGSLCNEDVLSGQSSFRLYGTLTTKIDNVGAKYPTKLPDVDAKLERLLPCVQALPSRAEVRDPETKKEQWYSSDKGVELLQKMVASFNSRSIEVDMSRDASTHNIQFNMDGGYCLDFPPDFPERVPLLTDSRGKRIPTEYDYKKAPDYCTIVVDAVLRQLQYGSGRR